MVIEIVEVDKLCFSTLRRRAFKGLFEQRRRVPFFARAAVDGQDFHPRLLRRYIIFDLSFEAPVRHA